MKIPKNIPLGTVGTARSGAAVTYVGPNTGSLCATSHPFRFSDGTETWSVSHAGHWAINSLQAHHKDIIALPGLVVPKKKKKKKAKAKKPGAKLSYQMRQILTRLDSIRSWTPPTEIGISLGRNHSAWASPKCLALVRMGYLERSAWGAYRRTKKRVPCV